MKSRLTRHMSVARRVALYIGEIPLLHALCLLGLVFVFAWGVLPLSGIQCAKDPDASRWHDLMSLSGVVLSVVPRVPQLLRTLYSEVGVESFSTVSILVKAFSWGHSLLYFQLFMDHDACFTGRLWACAVMDFVLYYTILKNKHEALCCGPPPPTPTR